MLLSLFSRRLCGASLSLFRSEVLLLHCVIAEQDMLSRKGSMHVA